MKRAETMMPSSIYSLFNEEATKNKEVKSRRKFAWSSSSDEEHPILCTQKAKSKLKRHCNNSRSIKNNRGKSIINSTKNSVSNEESQFLESISISKSLVEKTCRKEDSIDSFISSILKKWDSEDQELNNHSNYPNKIPNWDTSSDESNSACSKTSLKKMVKKVDETKSENQLNESTTQGSNQNHSNESKNRTEEHTPIHKENLKNYKSCNTPFSKTKKTESNKPKCCCDNSIKLTSCKRVSSSPELQTFVTSKTIFDHALKKKNTTSSRKKKFQTSIIDNYFPETKKVKCKTQNKKEEFEERNNKNKKKVLSKDKDYKTIHDIPAESSPLTYSNNTTKSFANPTSKNSSLQNKTKSILSISTNSSIDLLEIENCTSPNFGKILKTIESSSPYTSTRENSNSTLIFKSLDFVREHMLFDIQRENRLLNSDFVETVSKNPFETDREKQSLEILGSDFSIEDRQLLSQTNDEGNTCLQDHKNSNKSNLLECFLKNENLDGLLIEEYEKYVNEKNKNENDMDESEKLDKWLEERKYIYYKTTIERYKKDKTMIYRLNKTNILNDRPLSEINNNIIENSSKTTLKEESKFSSNLIGLLSASSISSVVSSKSPVLNESQRFVRSRLNLHLNDEKLISHYKEIRFSDCDKTFVTNKIRRIFHRIFDDLSNGKHPVLKYRKQYSENCVLKDERLQFKSENSVVSIINSASKCSRFKQILLILKKIVVLLENNTKITKRELYYQIKNFNITLSVTTKAVNTISCMLDVGSWSLNIISQKGLIYGDLKVFFSNGETLYCKPGVLIPQNIEDIIEIHSTAKFILVVEKEAIFHKLIDEDLPNKLTKPFIIITGKGFPDINTQLFLRKLWIVMSIPVFILVDGDPHGIDIMLNYRYGSVYNAHVSHELAVPNARWIGIYPSEMKTFDVETQELTAKEVTLLNRLINGPYAVNPDILKELKIMLESRRKAGIEALMITPVFLSEVYLPFKFCTNEFK